MLQTLATVIVEEQRQFILLLDIPFKVSMLIFTKHVRKKKINLTEKNHIAIDVVDSNHCW